MSYPTRGEMMGQGKFVHPYENDDLTSEAIAAAQQIMDQPTEEAYCLAFNAAEAAQTAAWVDGDTPGQEHWRLVFSAYVRLSRRRPKWESEYHNGMSAAMLAYPGDPRSNYEE